MSSGQLRVLVVMPSFYDLDTASELISEISRSSPPELEIHYVIVDESLGDDPAKEKVKWGQYVTFLNLGRRMGPQSALVAALRQLLLSNVPFDFVVTMDSDGEDKPSDVARLVMATDENVDIVLALRGGRSSSLKFRIFHSFYKLLFTILVGTPLRSGAFAVISRRWIERNIEQPEFSLSYSGALLTLPANRKELVCDRGIRRKGRSRMNLYDSISEGLRLLLPFSKVIAVRSFLAAISTAILAVVGLVWVAVLNFLGLATPGWSTSALTLIGGGVAVMVLISLIALNMVAGIMLQHQAISKPVANK